MIFNWFERMINHIGNERRTKPLFEASSREYWAINES